MYYPQTSDILSLLEHYMKTNITKKEAIFERMKAFQRSVSKLSANQKTKLENAWDVEHAYYSSVLEGSKLDRKEFEDLAKQA